MSAVSIHAPVRERQRTLYGVSGALRFNSRSREGATRVRDLRRRVPKRFNSRSREGATNPDYAGDTLIKFQFTLP